jgi:hypothetical protein
VTVYAEKEKPPGYTKLLGVFLWYGRSTENDPEKSEIARNFNAEATEFFR